MKRKPPSRLGLPRWLKWMLISTISTVLIILSVLVYLTAGAVVDTLFAAPLNPVGSGDAPVDRDGDGVPDLPPPLVAEWLRPGSDATPGADSAPPDDPLQSATLPPLDANGRLNVLVMGLDARPGEGNISRTDSLLLFSLDPATNSMSLLSIPRDLYVDIPGYGQDRINTAFVRGAVRTGDRAAGAQLAMATVSANLGVPVEHYILVDFQTVVDLIDAFGGVIIDVPTVINDPLYPDNNYGYDPLYIAAGLQTMDGELALKYMRTRHSDNDFGRARRQQQVILAFREQVMSRGVAGVLRRLPTIYQEVREGVFTDLSLDQLTAIADAVGNVGREGVKTGVLDYTYVYSYTTPGGSSVLLLREGAADALIAELFN